MAETETNTDAFDATVELAAAYASNANNRMTPDEYNGLVRSLFGTLTELSSQTSAPAAEPEAPAAADEFKTKAEIKKSIGATHLISFLDGKPYRSLKRHLSTQGLAPADYKAKFGLPNDYPMTHPDYSAARSAMAKAIGLGAKGRQARAETPPAAAPAAPKVTKPKARKAKPEPQAAS